MIQSMIPPRLRAALSSIRTPRTAPRLAARHVEWSLLSSADDLWPRPSRDLVELALEASRVALDLDLSAIADRCCDELDRTYSTLWPGEHYRLLAALSQVLRPDLVVEVGTATGLSALAVLHGGAERVVTFDVVPWMTLQRTLLTPDDFGERLEQRLGDLADAETFARNVDVLRAARIIFVDGPKDGVFEPAFLGRLLPVLREHGALLVLDDIRLLPMLDLWRGLDLPKLDVTSLGHWSGTGMARRVPPASG